MRAGNRPRRNRTEHGSEQGDDGGQSVVLVTRGASRRHKCSDWYCRSNPRQQYHVLAEKKICEWPVLSLLLLLLFVCLSNYYLLSERGWVTIHYLYVCLSNVRAHRGGWIVVVGCLFLLLLLLLLLLLPFVYSVWLFCKSVVCAQSQEPSHSPCPMCVFLSPVFLAVVFSTTLQHFSILFCPTGRGDRA